MVGIRKLASTAHECQSSPSADQPNSCRESESSLGHGRNGANPEEMPCCEINRIAGDREVQDASPESVVSNNLSARNALIIQEDLSAQIAQLIARRTGFPTRLSISTSVSMVNLAVFLFTTSDTRGRETIRISAASDCFK